MKTLNQKNHLGSKALKERFLQRFGVRANNAAALQEIIRELIETGTTRTTLLAWAVEAGYSRAHISSVLSRIFVALGLRERKKGAGRRPSSAALELLAHAQSRYGENFLRVLYAACRAGKAQLAAAASHETFQPPLNPNCTSTIRRATRPAGRTNGGRYRSANITFHPTFKPATGISSKRHGRL